MELETDTHNKSDGKEPSAIDYSRYDGLVFSKCSSAGYVTAREKIWYEPHESRVDPEKSHWRKGLMCRYQAVVPVFDPGEAETNTPWMDASAPSDAMVSVDTCCVFDPKSIEGVAACDVGIPIMLQGRWIGS